MYTYTRLTNITDVEGLKRLFSLRPPRVPRPYYTALVAALAGEGVKMNYDLDAYYGENDCLRTSPLDIDDIASIDLWLREIAKIDTKLTSGQGSLRAVLNHFKRVLSN